MNVEDTHKLIGHVTIYSGRLLFTDGLAINQLPLGDDDHVILDIEQENVRLPIYATQQGGVRFLLIPLDDPEKLVPVPDEQVQVTDPVEVPSPTVAETDANKNTKA